ncbi:winged helix-turn-helix transcriptional regulator [Ruegeria arenilitoris]|uniref:winged helix-turn-helix transcriptional regulator n=1 Tax=Ruegeria arenilitoris TaxID=1173585 RepID=UPI00148050DE|nr:helix-turn-helix domain-containing protein [Ruegeria arenilitoris]
MTKNRSYKLLCPIARALDRIGDRWTLLILRDLHAGPARFSDLQRGLTGIAANLLTDRLAKLVGDGLVVKTEGAHGTSVYELTDLGEKTSDIIFELAMFGARFAPEEELVTPGNLRTVATTIGAAAKRVATPELNLDASFVVDGEQMHLSVHDGRAKMIYAPCPEPDLILSTGYLDLLAVSEGDLTLDEFVRGRCELRVLTQEKERGFVELMTNIVALMNK